MFRRKDSAAPVADETPVEARPGAKNRPTPKRRDQEAARKQPLVVTDRKAARAADRARRAQSTGQVRQAMMTGDDRHLPNRDKGPVRRYIRDYVDARWNVAEFLLPFMLIVLAAQFVNREWGFYIFVFVYVLVIAAVIDGVLAWRRMKRQVRAKFGADTSTKGLAAYAGMRMMQIRPTRMPRPQVDRGDYPG